MNVITEILSKWGERVLLSGFVLLLSDCNGHNSEYVTPKDYVAYISNKENGLIQQKEIDDIVYEVRYLSPEAMALAELHDLNTAENKLKNTVKEYGKMAYFRVNIGARQGHLFNALRAIGKNPDELESYLNFAAEKDFMAYTSTDTVNCGLYNFSRTYGVSNSWQLMLAFDLTKWDKKSDLIVSYDDKLSNSGQLNFRFSEKDIANLPKLIY